MKAILIASIVTVTLFSACGSAPAPAPAPAPVVTPAPVVVSIQGNWSGNIKSGTTSFTMNGTVSDSGGILAGTMTICPLGICVTSTSLSGSRANTNVTMTAVFASGYELNFNLALSANNMSGTASDTDGASFQVTLNK